MLHAFCIIEEASSRTLYKKCFYVAYIYIFVLFLKWKIYFLALFEQPQTSKNKKSLLTKILSCFGVS